jgi:hypothetical protein
MKWAKGEIDVCGPAVDKIFVRRNFEDKYVGQLTIDTRSKPLHRVLELLRLCGATQQQAEQYLLLGALENTVFANQILAVRLTDTCTGEQNGRTRTHQMAYSDDKHGRLQVFTQDPGVAASMADKVQRARIMFWTVIELS